jgi:hypothetical protein
MLKSWLQVAQVENKQLICVYDNTLEPGQRLGHHAGPTDVQHLQSECVGRWSTISDPNTIIWYYNIDIPWNQAHRQFPGIQTSHPECHWATPSDDLPSYVLYCGHIHMNQPPSEAKGWPAIEKRVYVDML